MCQEKRLVERFSSLFLPRYSYFFFLNGLLLQIIAYSCGHTFLVFSVLSYFCTKRLLILIQPRNISPNLPLRGTVLAQKRKAQFQTGIMPFNLICNFYEDFCYKIFRTFQCPIIHHIAFNRGIAQAVTKLRRPFTNTAIGFMNCIVGTNMISG